ncbi:MAG: FtsH protease activity modulator HflK [Rhodospirillales bacterium]|nr:FtsH protease activity modulator HflK [Rhodospirillales bacterium]
MPWNQGGGGGPWGGGGGGGGQNPWNRPPGGGGSGQQPPNIEDLIRRGQERVKRLFPGGFGSGKGVALVVLALLALWLASGFYRVQPNEQGVVLRFGQWVRTAQPGLNYHLPGPIESVLTPRVTAVNSLDIGFRGAAEGRGVRNRSVPEEGLMLTGDENIIDIQYTVFWLIKDAGLFLFNIASPELTVKAAAESAMREVVGQMPAQFALAEGRRQIEEQTQKLLQQILDQYGAGVLITQVQLRAVDPPTQVIDAFRDVQRAKADRERARNEAEAYRNDIVPRARGEGQRLIQEAEAYRQQVIAQAQGEAQRFVSVFNAYRLAPEVTKQRLYLETMELIFKGNSKVIIDQSPGSGPGVVPYLPLPEIQRRATGQGAR